MHRCPDCDEPVPAAAINIKEGFALCPQCGVLSRLSDLIASERSVQEILSEPPAGCSIKPRGDGVIATVSLWSLTSFLGLCLFAAFWNGIISIPATTVIAGLYYNLIGPVPDWFPAPGIKQGIPFQNGEPMGLGTTLYLSMFLTPFVAIGIAAVAGAILNLLGKVEVVIDEHDSWVATRIWFFRWKRRFDARRVRAIAYGRTAWQSGDGTSARVIELAADRTIKFGSWLDTEELVWLKVVLNEVFPLSKRIRRLELPPLNWLAERRTME